jgi:mannose-6-phosphate isomerase-like protein (cupin superfamily)
MQLVKWVRLPFRFDLELLRADLRRIEEDPWTVHFNRADYSGDWSGIALRSPSGSADSIFSPPGCTEFRNTDAFERCQYFPRVVETFECPVKAVRLLRLRAGSAILEHTDQDLRFEEGEMRVHVPVQTNPDVEFVVDGRRLVLNEGDCWYIDFSLPHRIRNRGAADRIHLVIHAQVNDWARAMVESAAKETVDRPGGAPECGGFEQFRELVFEDGPLQALLMAAPDQEAFCAQAVEHGRARGFHFTRDDVECAIRSGRRAWSERLAKV